MQNDDNNKSFSFSVDIQHDVMKSMQQQITDLSISLSKISIKNQELQQFYSKQKIPKCSEGHPLRYMYADTTSGVSFRLCDRCNKKVLHVSTVYWCCLRCDFDLCQQCQSHKKTVCPFAHPLQYVSKYQHNGYSCDICMTKNLQKGWHCDCDFDICQKCHKSQ